MPPRYLFLPWVRSGLGAFITTPDSLDASTQGVARLDVLTRVLRDHGPAFDVTRALRLFGPGDVSGLDPGQVLRTDPRPDATDVEPNYLVQVEFDRAELPWLCTPAAPDSQQRLRPWLVLIVVERGRGVRMFTDSRTAAPTLELTRDADASRILPDLADSWAWAHTQLLVHDGESPSDVLAHAPDRTLSRLICPRRLDPDTPYLACVVPAFESGRRAGLGLSEEPADSEGLRPAWNPGADIVELPVYHSWSFTTGSRGDFESLARSLRPRPLPEGVGRFPLYVGAAGPPLPSLAPDAPGAVVELPGALVAPGSFTAPWPSVTREMVFAGLQMTVESSALAAGFGALETNAGDASTNFTDPLGGPDPVVAPPFYGQWPAARATLPDTESSEPTWLRELNVDPRRRAMAGVGALLVRAEQEAFMEQAWAQVGDVEAANELLRWGQVARHVRASIMRRHLRVLDAADLVAIATPSHARLRDGEISVSETVRRSAVPNAVVTAAFRRVTGPQSALARRLIADPVARRRSDGGSLLSGLDGGWLKTPTDAMAPDGLFGFTRAAPARVGVDEETRAGIAEAAARTRNVKFRGVSSAALASRRVDIATSRRVLLALGEVPSGGLRAALRFRDAAADVVRSVEEILAPSATPLPPPIGVAALRDRILTGLDPHRTVQDRLGAVIPQRPGPVSGRDPLEEIMAAPTFTMSGWELLRSHFPALLLPGLDRVPVDTATLAAVNRGFLEAVLVGANHELARELLWREYPTDVRASPMRRFWAPGGADDIASVHRWHSGSLGSHPADPALEVDGALVLLLRGRLLYRYPHTVVYAAPDRDGQPDLRDEAIRVPRFSGRLDPDALFCGFTLTKDEALAAPGWWFVLEEQPTAPRFGLDVANAFGTTAGLVGTWQDLSWGHLVADSAGLSRLGFLRSDLDPPAPPQGPRWGSTAAAMAAILVQHPVRVALRAADLLARGDVNGGGTI